MTMLRLALVSLLTVSVTTARPFASVPRVFAPKPTSLIIERELAVFAIRGGAEVATKPAQEHKPEAKTEAKKEEATKEEAKPPAKPAEAKKEDAKPAEVKKDEAKKEEVKPPVKTEAKPTEAKKEEVKPPAKAEAKPAEAKKEEAKKEEAKPPTAKLFARIAAAEGGIGLGEAGEGMVGIKRVQRLEAQFEIGEAGSLFNRLGAIETMMEKSFGRIAAAESRMGLGKAADAKAMMVKRMAVLEEQLEIAQTGSLKSRLEVIEATVEKKLGRIAAAETRMGLGKPDEDMVMMKRAERLEKHFEIESKGSFKSRMTIIEAVIDSHGF